MSVDKIKYFAKVKMFIAETVQKVLRGENYAV